MAGREFQPYVGPCPFERKDDGLFFGRDREIQDIKSLVISHQAVLFYAQSGAGKTSLLNAGLIPALEKEGFEVLPPARVRGLTSQDLPNEQIPNTYVFNTLMNWTDEKFDSKLLTQMSLPSFLNERTHLIDEDGETLFRIIIFDQFEELFSFYPERWQEREGFFHQVAEALKADPLLRVLFVIREDFLANLDSFFDLLPERLRTRYRLERLRQESACLAVERPLRDTGYSFAEGVASSLVQQLLTIRLESDAGKTIETAGEYVEPVQLQVVCQSLWLNLPSNVTVITSEHLHAFGDVDQALKDFYERTIETSKQTGVDERNLRNWFDNKLITPAGTRGTVFRGKEYTEGIHNSAIDVLEDQHIIRAEIRAGARWYELTHDRLIEPIQKSNEDWFQNQIDEEQQREIEVERQRAEEQQQRATEQTRIARRFRRLTAALVVMFMVALVISVYALLQRRTAQTQAKISFSRQLGTQAEMVRNQRADKLPLSVLLAIESIKRSPSIEGDQALRNGLSLLPRHITCMPHKDYVASVTFSPDGKYIATASYDNTVKVWELTSSKLIATMPHESEVSSVVYSPDGMNLATASYDNNVRVYEAAKGKLLIQMTHEDSVTSVTFSPNGKYLATASYDNTARVWEAASGKLIAQMSHDDIVYFVAFNPDGKYLATASRDKTARVWKPLSGKLVARMTHEGCVYSLAFSPDGKYLATASWDKTARVWEAVSGKLVAQMTHGNILHYVAFSPDGKYLATASRGEAAWIYEAISGKPVVRLPYEALVSVDAFSPDGNYLVTANRENTARLWEAKSGKPVLWMPHEQLVSSVVFSPNGKYLATASFDRNVCVWEVPSSGSTNRMIHDDEVNSVAFSSDGKYLATASNDNTARVWEVASGKSLILLPHDDDVYSVSFSPDGKYLATASGDSTARLWELSSGKPVVRMNHDADVHSVTFSPDGKYIATASWDKTPGVWEAASGKLIARMPHDNSVYSVAFSPDGKCLATASRDGIAIQGNGQPARNGPPKT